MLNIIVCVCVTRINRMLFFNGTRKNSSNFKTRIGIVGVRTFKGCLGPFRVLESS